MIVALPAELEFRKRTQSAVQIIIAFAAVLALLNESPPPMNVGAFDESLTMPSPRKPPFIPPVNEYAGAEAVTWIVSIDPLPLIVTAVGAPLLVNVATPVGTEPVDQFDAVNQSDEVAPVHVASCAIAGKIVAIEAMAANSTATLLC